MAIQICLAIILILVVIFWLYSDNESYRGGRGGGRGGWRRGGGYRHVGRRGHRGGVWRRRHPGWWRGGGGWGYPYWGGYYPVTSDPCNCSYNYNDCVVSGLPPYACRRDFQNCLADCYTA